MNNMTKLYDCGPEDWGEKADWCPIHKTDPLLCVIGQRDHLRAALVNIAHGNAEVAAEYEVIAHAVLYKKAQEQS